MPKVARKGDSCTGHPFYPPRSSSAGSHNVFANSIPVHRNGDGWSSHCKTKKPFDCHGASLAGGSSTVFANGRRLGRVGDAVSCGGSAASGSNNVFAN